MLLLTADSPVTHCSVGAGKRLRTGKTYVGFCQTESDKEQDRLDKTLSHSEIKKKYIKKSSRYKQSHSSHKT